MLKKKTKDKVVTEKMLNNALSDFADTILGGIDEMYSGLKKEISEFREENASEHLEINRKLRDLSADTPTLRQHMVLDEKINNHLNYHHIASS